MKKFILFEGFEKFEMFRSLSVAEGKGLDSAVRIKTSVNWDYNTGDERGYIG